jgi:hypothetical protein
MDYVPTIAAVTVYTANNYYRSGEQPITRLMRRQRFSRNFSRNIVDNFLGVLEH